VTKQQAYHARKPWVRFVSWAQDRCKSDSPQRAPYYKEKGITCTLTAAQAEILWVRDGAAKMLKPSLDRKNPDKGYHIENCRFREFALNVRAPHDPAAQAALDAELAALCEFA
jgi:hypothetical protein